MSLSQSVMSVSRAAMASLLHLLILIPGRGCPGDDHSLLLQKLYKGGGSRLEARGHERRPEHSLLVCVRPPDAAISIRLGRARRGSSALLAEGDGQRRQRAVLGLLLQLEVSGRADRRFGRRLRQVAREPRVLQQLVQSRTVGRAHPQTLADQVLALGRQSRLVVIGGEALAERHVSAQDLLVQLEGHVAAHHGVQQDAQRPDGGAAAVVLARADPLGRRVHSGTCEHKVKRG